MKIRVWHKELHKFLPKEEWFLDFDGNLKFFNIGVLSCGFLDDVDKELYIVQRWTGLNDKNGKEIYEGDVVKVQRGFIRPYVNNGEIDYKMLEGELEIGQVFWGMDAEFLVEYKGYDDSEKLRNIPHRYEVLGNIYENPELLL